MSVPDCKQCGNSEDIVLGKNVGLYLEELTGESHCWWCKHCKVFIDDDGDVIEIWERDDDDWHDCETNIPGFDNSDRLIQKDLGPLHLRYVLEGRRRNKSPYSMYTKMVRWTGGSKWKVDPQKAFDKREDDIEDLANAIVDFIQSRTYFRHEDDGEFCGDGTITVITPPKSCDEYSGNCSKKKQKNHLGYKIGYRVYQSIREIVGDVKHIMAYDLYECDFPSVSGVNAVKARRKFGGWVDEASTSTMSSISESDLVVIVDDTMVSYMTQLRIAMSVRKYNLGAPILCAAVFGVIPWDSGSGSGGPEKDSYPHLKRCF